LTDELVNEDGDKVRLEEPKGNELPPKGFDVKDRGYVAPAEDGSEIQVWLGLIRRGLSYLSHLTHGRERI